ncbi:MAG: Fe-S cluster assembly protein SufD [Alphaproteobacteria bacterium]|nr:Fe-S cluster assembly protein SufD [Alphaproteobacteria bacterium]
MSVALSEIEASAGSAELFASAAERRAATPARRAAWADFERLGLPHRRIEDWKYTDLRRLLGPLLPLAPPPREEVQARVREAVRRAAVVDAHSVVLVDGVFMAELSDAALCESGVTLRSLREVPGEAEMAGTGAGNDAMLALNAALATDGVVLEIAERRRPQRPLHIIHVACTDQASSFTRSGLHIGAGVAVTVIESFVTAAPSGGYQVSDRVEIEIGDNAEVCLVRLMDDAPDAVNLTSTAVRIGAGTKLNFFNMTSGAALSRLAATFTLAGEGATLSFGGVSLLASSAHGDTTVVVDHAVPGCASREEFRAVVDERGHSVFQGRIIVRAGAQKTDARMVTRALLLSDQAEADNKPELEIFANDVACAYGATTGALDESLLFYLRARGIPEKEAQALLIQGFVGEAMELIADEAVRLAVQALPQLWLERRGT